MHFLICDGDHLIFPLNAVRPARRRSGNSASVDYD